MKKVYWFVLLISLISDVYGQRISNDFLPRVISPSPEVAGMERHISYPINMFSGVPDISIPIYNIEINDMKVPITLSYHASGFKVIDQGGWAGLGWSLFAGGAINRQVMGLPDEKWGYLNGNYPINMTGIDLFNDVNDLRMFYENRWDGQADVYSYSFPGLSGKFYYANRNKDQPVVIPYNPIKITTTINNTSLEFQVLDDKGIEYRMGPWGESSYTSQGLDAMTSWPIKQMISANKKDTIEFIYADNTFRSLEEQIDYIRVVDQVTGAASASQEPYGNRYFTSVTPTTSSTSSVIGTLRIQEIKFRNGKVVFEPSTNNRLDVPEAKSLSKISIYSKNASGTFELIKSVKLNTSYFFPNSTSSVPFRLRLDNLQITDNNNAIVNQYKFEYNQNVPITGDYLRARDYWGYYNGKNNTTLVPHQNITIQGSEVGNSSTTQWIGSDLENSREPDPDFNQVFNLKKIVFPSGGYKEFDYETNKYYDETTQTTKYGGGLRVKQIRFFESTGVLASKKTYKYGHDENGRGNIIIPLPTRFFHTEQMEYPCYDISDYYCRVRNYVSSPNVAAEPYDGTPVGYEEVTEFDGDEIINNGKTVYKYSFTQDGFTSLYQLNKPDVVSYHYKRGLLTEQATYKKNIDNTYKLLRKVNNQYGAFPDNSIGAQNIVVFEPVIYDDQTRCISSGNGFGFNPPYQYNSYSITTGDNKLIETTEISYSSADNTYLTQTTDYLYGSQTHQQITQIKKTSSQGSMLITENKYATDFISDATLGPVSTKMVNANMLSYPIEQVDLKNSIPLKSVKTIYNDWSNTSIPQIAPQIIQTKQGNNAYENIIRYYAYDASNNILSVSKENDVQKSYIWGYNNFYPVAEFSGISYANAIGLLNQAIIQYPPSDQALRDELNKIRQNYPGAFVTIYTYKPLVGMTSQTDINDRTTYYVYDNFNRLAFIKDQDGNVLKKYCYNYAGQAESCGVYTWQSEARSGNFMAVCAAGGVSSMVTYTVPAGAYTSTLSQLDANTKAQADVNQNGQAYANSHGCTWGSDALSGVYFSQNCGPGQSPDPYNVSFAAGAYTSTVSKADANSKVQAAAQSQANIYGVCTCNCTSYGEGWACVYGSCQQGYKVYTGTYFDGYTYYCMYHYEYSDGTWSTTYYEPSNGSNCAIK